METYRVGVYVEEGVVLYVDAENDEKAKEQAQKVLDYHAGVSYPKKYLQKTVHRDYMVTDVEEA